ncbi:hypothetical protein R5R35_000592 [Gryllus longicercus]|uniref:Group XV phospholipase A2 n=1 Tax=Gryllus longicercus TaxID=2509291 RepID=A0AAN9VFT9_9ORTH
MLLISKFVVGMLIALAAQCLCYSVNRVENALPGPPVILVPGDGGSQVEAKLHKKDTVHYLCQKNTQDYFNIWLNMELLVPIVIDCWIDNIKLVYDNKTRKTYNSDGVDIRIPGFGNTSTVEWLDPSQAVTGAYFKDVGNALVAMGYERNVSIRGAPYDFRKAPNENQQYFVDLKALIEETYTINGNKPVVIIAHSMGAPMTMHFLGGLKQRWKNKYIRALVTLSGAWAGSVKALKVYLVGDDLGSYVLRESVMKDEQITSPSLAWLMPSSVFWKPSEVLVQTPDKNYTVNDFEEFFRDIYYEVGWEMRKDVQKLDSKFTAPGVEIHCLHGFGVNTIERLVYKPGKFPDGYPNFIFGDGDGTVNKRSLEACMHWESQQKQRIYHQTFPNVDHMEILRNENVLEYITTLMKKLTDG